MDSAYWIFSMQTLVKIQNQNLSVFVREERWSKENISPVKNKIQQRLIRTERMLNTRSEFFLFPTHTVLCSKRNSFCIKNILKMQFSTGLLVGNSMRGCGGQGSIPKKSSPQRLKELLCSVQTPQRESPRQAGLLNKKYKKPFNF